MADTKDKYSDVASTDPVGDLVRRGEHPAAAALAESLGDLPRAVSLYRRVWRFADAVPLAVRMGDLALAVELSLEASWPDKAWDFARAIPTDDVASLQRAARALAARGRYDEAGQTAERLRDWPAAARHYRRAGRLLDVGRAHEMNGQVREAGLAYEQALAADSDEAGSVASRAAHLALGRLLGRMGQHRDAARSLQRALAGETESQASLSEQSLSAARALVAELLALGFGVAANEVALRVHRLHPDQPADADALAALDQAEQSANLSPSGKVHGEPGLLRQRFRIIRALGAGATSQVYWAEDTLLGHDVALKLLSVGSHAAGVERSAYERFAREAEAVGRLRHPNIVALFDADPHLGMFVMERMSGGTLAERLAADGPLAAPVVRRLALDLLAALGAAHDRGIVHRDVKPANILFDAVGNAKLGDFGAAHLADFGQTQTGGLMGTVAYMSPEQITGSTIGPAADLYAAGVTLFEALTGRPPFEGPDIVAQHLGEEAPRASTVVVETSGAAISSTLDEILVRALEKAPSQRWATAEEMAAAIQRCTFDESSAIRTKAADDRARPEVDAPSQSRELDGADKTGSGDMLLGRSHQGRLFRREDPRLRRSVLVLARDTSLLLDAEALADIRNRAAAGGAWVQRVLGVSDDGLEVIYEWLEGDAKAPDAAPPQLLATLDRIVRGLVAEDILGSPDDARILWTSTGPVITLCPILPATDAPEP